MVRFAFRLTADIAFTGSSFPAVAFAKGTRGSARRGQSSVCEDDDRFHPRPIADGLGLASGPADTFDVIEREDEWGERLRAELGADRRARVASAPAIPEGSCP